MRLPTILLSPVMLDSSIASDCPEIKIPSAGTWDKKFNVEVNITQKLTFATANKK